MATEATDTTTALALGDHCGSAGGLLFVKSKSRGRLANGLHAKSDCSVAILGSLVLLILSAERSAWVATIVTGSAAFAIVLPNYPRAHVWRWEREPAIICRVPEKSLSASESLIFTEHA